MDHQPAAGFLALDPADVADGQPGGSATKAELSRALVATFGSFKQEMAAHLAAFGLSSLQARSLRHLDRPMTMRQLADAIGTEPSNLTAVVDRLESAGLVRRRAKPGDRRIRELCVTAQGERIRHRLDTEVYGTLALFDRLTDRQQAQLLRLLNKLASG